jgi:hypothetical protein
VREVEGGGQGVSDAPGGGGQRQLWEEGFVDWYVLSSQRPPLYMGGGGCCTLPPPQGIPRAAAKGGEAVAARAGGAQPPPKTLTLAGLVQEPRAPLFFFRLDGLLSEIGPLGEFIIY